MNLIRILKRSTVVFLVNHILAELDPTFLNLKEKC